MNFVPTLFLLLGMTISGAFAGFCLKKTAVNPGLKMTISSPFFYAGGLLYVAAAIGNIVLLRILPYSLVLPLTSITYIWTLLIARLFLGEKITLLKIAGVLLILFGAVFITLDPK